MSDVPKYAIVEIERRWLVDPAAVEALVGPEFREIEDLYITGSRLRLRKVSGAARTIFKLCKKYGRHTSLCEPITNLYLTEEEYCRLAGLPGSCSRKRRYSIASGVLDVYEAPDPGLAVFEVEFPDELSAKSHVPPDFVAREITGNASLGGAALAAGRARDAAGAKRR